MTQTTIEKAIARGFRFNPESNLAGPRLVSYDLPLRPDLLVRLNLPIDLTDQDAQRIATFVSSLAFAPLRGAQTTLEE